MSYDQRHILPVPDGRWLLVYLRLAPNSLRAFLHAHGCRRVRIVCQTDGSGQTLCDVEEDKLKD
jgi:hypothetical protein